MKKETIKNCKNCEQPFKEVYEYCPHCGQKDKDDLTLGLLFYNTVANYFSFDARFFKSFFPLLFKPGYIAEKFIEGKRLLYLHPAQMYLFIAVVFFFLFSFKVNNQAEEFDKGLADAFNNEVTIDTLSVEAVAKKRISDSILREEARASLKESSIWTGMSEKQIDSLVNDKNFNLKKNNINLAGPKVDSLIKINAPDIEIYKAMGLEEDSSGLAKRFYAQYLKFLKSKKGSSILQTFYDTVPIAMFFVLPLFALILKLFYFNRGRYSHHLVFSFYYFSFIFTVFSLLVGVNFIVNIASWINWLIVLSVFIYLVIALKRFYKQGWFKSLFKASLATMAFFPVVLIAVCCVIFFAFMFY